MREGVEKEVQYTYSVVGRILRRGFTVEVL
jgi:hypothetical protein